MFTRLILILSVSVWYVSCSSGGGSDSSGGGSGGTTVSKLFLEDNWTCAVRSDNSVKCIGYDYNISTPTSSFITSILNPDISSFNENRNCSIDSSNNLLCWGANSHGELGRGTVTASSYIATVPTGLTGQIIKVSAHYSACAITITGALYCWGDTTYSQLGLNNASATPYSTPQLVAGFTASDVAVGPVNVCIISTAGVKCAGYNFYGAVGDTTNTDRPVFTNVSGLPAGASQIVMANSSTFCALFTGGAVRCWGYGLSGQLGNSAALSSNVPVTPTGLTTGVTKLAASPGAGAICALKSGEVYCWGYNGNGAIGDGTLASKSTPIKITTLGSDNANIYASGEHTCVLKTAGTVYCWGDSAFDEAGKVCSSLPCRQLTPVLMDL